MADEPVERLYVSIEADIAALLLKTAGAVDQLEKRLREMERKGKRSFDNTGKSAKKMGVIIGAVSGMVQTLTRQLIHMARQVPRAFAGVIKATLEANKLFEKFSTQFTTLLGGTEAAQERVQELVEFNIKTPFELPEIVEASRVLEVFGGSLLATGDNLRMVGDIAAGVNRPIEDVALWIGRAYDALQNGRPFGIAALALQRMGALSGEARAELERMQEQGIKGEAAWSRFVELVGTRFQGNMERLAQTLVGIQSNLADFNTELLRLSGEPLFENIKRDAQRFLDVLTRNRQPITDFGVALGEIAASVEELAVSGALAQLEQLDPQAVEDLSDAMERFADALSRLTDKEITGDINGLVEVLTILVDLLTSLINTVNKVKEPLDKFNEATEPIAPALNAIKTVLLNLTNPLAAIINLVRQGTTAFRDLNDALEETLGFRLVNLSKDLAEATEPRRRRVAPRRGRGAAPEVLDPITPVIDEFDENADELKDLLRDLTTDMLDEVVDRQEALEELEEDHADRMAEIAEDGARKRAEIDRRLQKDLAKLARDTAQKRAEIFKDTQRELEELARDTDDRLTDERDDFQTEERRDTEDHLRDMRRLTQQYLFDLEDAVKERDARAVVDLQRRFAMESQQREEDFSVNQQRDRQDFDQRLAEIRENEAERRQEILRGQAEELTDLMQHEARRRAEIELSHQEQLTRLDEQLALARQKEMENYAERQADLQNALADRLQAIARELADEEDVNEQSARRILSTLNRFFGVGGDIDQLMNDFMRRRSQRMIVDITFEGQTAALARAQSAVERVQGMFGRIPRFQGGGSMVARKPTLALFGEGGPEVAQFTPLNQMGGGGGPQRIQIEFSGSAPPGIRGPERDQIAGVLMSALRDTGVLER